MIAHLPQPASRSLSLVAYADLLSSVITMTPVALVAGYQTTTNRLFLRSTSQAGAPSAMRIIRTRLPWDLEQDVTEHT
jgi:hypothetical protein